MTDKVTAETPADRGHQAVEREVTASGASQAINREIGQNISDPRANKEFLQAASFDLQVKGILPEMAVDFGKKYFGKIDTDKDGYASEAEIRKALQKGGDQFTPAERLAGNYLADKIGDQKTGMGNYYKGFATQAELDKYQKETATKYDEHLNGQQVLKAFGNEKDFRNLDKDKNGYVSEQEMKDKLTYNELRLSEPDLGKASRQKYEEENKALKFMMDHQSDMAKGNGTWTSNQLTLNSIRKYAGEHGNPGLNEGQYKVSDEMVRASAEAEAAAIAAKSKQSMTPKSDSKNDDPDAKSEDAKAKDAKDKEPKDKDSKAKDKPWTPWKKNPLIDIDTLEEDKPQTCKPGDKDCKAGTTDEKTDPKDEKDLYDNDGSAKDDPKKLEKKDKPADDLPKAPEKELSKLEQAATQAGAYTLDTVAAAYNDAAKNGKGVAMMIVGANTPGSQELLAKLPALREQNPNLNFVVIDKDQVNKSTDAKMAPWKSWIDSNLKDCNGQPTDYAKTSVQSLKVDSNGVASPEKVTSTHWGANIEAGLKDQARYAADGTRRNVKTPPAETVNPVKVPEAPKPDEELNKVENQKTNKDKPADRPREIQYARTQADIDAAIKANAELGLPTIIDVTRSQGCGNCDAQNPVLAKLAKDHPGQIIKIDADSDLGRRHSIPGSTLPNIFVLSKTGQRTAAYQGFQQPDVISRALSAKN